MINFETLNPLVREFFHLPVSVHRGILKTCQNYLPAATANLFLAHCAEELLCFCHFYPEWIAVRGQSAFAVIGYDCDKGSFAALIRTFPNAKIYTMFGNDLAGRVWDSKLSLWQIGLDAGFRISGEHLKVSFMEKEMSFSVASFTLNRFFKTIGKFQTTPALKPRGGYRNFAEKFRAGCAV